MVTPGAGRSPPILATPLIRKYVTAIPAKILALRVFIGQEANC